MIISPIKASFFARHHAVGAAAGRGDMARPTFTFMMRRHTRLKEPMRQVYSDLIAGLVGASTTDWPFDRSKVPKLGRIGSEDLASFNSLSRCYERRVRCHVHFRVRESHMPDNQSADDVFVLDWQPKTDDYMAFVTDLVPACINAFRPYRATLGPAELMSIDWEKVRLLNSRYEVGRISPVDYLSAGLCKSSFGKTPKKCAMLIRQSRLHAEVHAGGLLVRSDRLLELNECEAHNTAVRLALLR